MTYEKEFIEHLSRDIASHTSFLMTFRSRMAFTILIGPFILLGSFLIATQANDPVISIETDETWAIVIACVCYMGLGVYGAVLDMIVTRQCDIWRNQIESLHTESTKGNEDIGYQYMLMWSYVCGMALALMSFLSIAYFVNSVLVP